MPIQRLASSLDGEGQDFAGQRLAAVALAGAKLAASNLRGCELIGAELAGADLQRADLREARLQDARMRGAQLRNARLEDADLRGADLTEATLDGAQLAGASIDILTFEQSGWSADDLFSLRERGAKIVGLDAFPEAVRARLLSTQEGLTLCFRTRLDRFDRVLVEGTIVGVLGRDTDCDIAEFRNLEEGAVVRLTARQRSDLERVAEALYRKVWEEEQRQAEEEARRHARSEDRALVRMLDLLQSPQLRDGLSSLRNRLDAMELREPEAPPLGQEALVHISNRASHSKTEPADLRWRLRLPQVERGGNHYEIKRPWRILLHHTPADAPHADTLRKHLAPLVREGLAEIFEPILPGATIQETQHRRVQEADALLALLSADYWASDDCDAFLRQALKRPQGELHIVPVLVRSATLEGTCLIGRKPLPEDGRAVTEWPNPDAAWKNVADGLRLLLRSAL